MAQGVNFESDMSIKKVFSKAKKANKYIFLDVYATWCIPCKQMDKDVYQSKNVGDVVNNRFISSKIQHDKTEKDPYSIKINYSEFDSVIRKYEILSLPTLLFFSPGGDLVKRRSGYQNAKEFLALIEEASNPASNFENRIRLFNENEYPDSLLGNLALEALIMKDSSNASKIAKKYKDYLESLPVANLKKHIFYQFISEFPYLLFPDDHVFNYLYLNQENVDSIAKIKGFANSWVVYAIKREVHKRFWNNKLPVDSSPIWTDLFSELATKYDTVTSRQVVYLEKFAWYKFHNNNRELTDLVIENIERKGIDTSESGLGKMELNNNIYKYVFKLSSDKVALNKAIGWMEAILRSGVIIPAWLDTYAQLLYKRGRVIDALIFENIAFHLAVAQKKSNAEEYRKSIDLINKGLPTW